MSQVDGLSDVEHTERYRVDRERVIDGETDGVIAWCVLRDTAEHLASSLNQLEGAVEKNERLCESLGFVQRERDQLLREVEELRERLAATEGGQ